MIFVALTADALQSLEEFCYPCYPISDIANTYPLVQEEEKYTRDIFLLLQEIENYIGQRYLPAKFEGPGFLSGSYCSPQYAITAIAKRAYLMREAICFLSPSIVTAFNGEINEWFAGYGYEKNPWLDTLEIFSKEYQYKLNFVLINVNESQKYPDYQEGCFFLRCISYPTRHIKNIFNKMTCKFFNFKKTETLSKEYNGLRVIFANTTCYDWGPVLKLFETNKKINSFLFELPALTEHWGTAASNSSLKEIFSNNEYKLNVESPVFKVQESKYLEQLFVQWLKERPHPPKIIVLGIDIFPFLVKRIKKMVIEGPEIIRYTDKISLSALKIVKPHAACFFSIIYLPERRFAYQCEKLGIPVVVYHHGFGYNVKIQPPDEGTDQASADYILSYGKGTDPRSNLIFPNKAKFIPVGSARIENMGQFSFYKNGDDKCEILWIAETTTHNTWNGTLTEDTNRFKIQKKCLNTLSKNEKNHVIYRPLKVQLFNDGTSSWIKNERNPCISIDSFTPLGELIVNSDIIILDISSPNTWAEVINLNKPMILYYDLRQSPLTQDFIPDLEQACHWCKTENELYITINRLVGDREKFLDELRSIDTTEFKKKYLLHKGRCAQRVCSFLNEVCRNKKDIHEWESELDKKLVI
jgi:hypothetical protein